MSKVYGLNYLKIRRKVKLTAKKLIDFEDYIKREYENGKIKGPIHLSKGNEKQLIQIFKYIDRQDFVFTAWRNHYHAMLHGVPSAVMLDQIFSGNSMGMNYDKPFLYSSSIVGGIIPIALGVAIAQKRLNSRRKVWCFIGDMTMETGSFFEAYKYSINFDLPIKFVIEDNNLSVHTPTKAAWKRKMKKPNQAIHYTYKNQYPHHGTGKWINF